METIQSHRRRCQYALTAISLGSVCGTEVPDGKFISKGEIQSRPPESAWAVMESKYGEAYRQWWSSEIRLKDMDGYEATARHSGIQFWLVALLAGKNG